MRINIGIVRAAVAVATATAAIGLTSGAATAAPPRTPAPSASCVASITVAETQIAPGFVGDEVRRITEFGPTALPSLVRLLATHHLGGAASCAALIGE